MNPKLRTRAASAATTLAVLVVGAALGWYSMTAWRSLTAPSPIRHGDFSAVVDALESPVVLFATTTCPYCRQARAALDASGTSYRLLEIDTSKDAKRLFETLRGQGVPLLVTRYEAVTGFDAAAYRRLTGRSVAAR